MTTVLVTGASGFVGKALSVSLAARGHMVRNSIRTLRDKPLAQAYAVGDIGPGTDWAAAVTGCEAVIHVAAHVHVTGSRARDSSGDYHRVNVAGSENLARQAARAGVRRFVFLSSVKVNGDISSRAFVESEPAKPVDAYGVSKMEAEERLLAVSAETGMEVVIVRPPLVYGPGVRANFLSLMRTVDARVPLPFLSIGNRRSLVYLGNLVDALATCLTHPAAANRTFFVSDDHDVSTSQLIREIATALGKKPLLFPFPPALLRCAGVLTGRTAQIDRLTESLQVDVSAIKTALNWHPPFSLQQGLGDTASWYRTQFG